MRKNALKWKSISSKRKKNCLPIIWSKEKNQVRQILFDENLLPNQGNGRRDRVNSLQASMEDGVDFIPKPFTTLGLTYLVRKILDQS